MYRNINTVARLRAVLRNYGSINSMFVTLEAITLLNLRDQGYILWDSGDNITAGPKWEAD